MNHKFIPLFLFALLLVAFSLVGDFLYRAPAQLTVISTTNVQRPVPIKAKRIDVVNPRTSMLVVKLTSEKAAELYPILTKKPTNAPNLPLFKKYKGTQNAPIWAKPLYRFNVGGKLGAMPKNFATNKFLQDIAGYLIVKFPPTADLDLVSKELANDTNVVYAAENTLTQLNPTISVPVMEGAIAVGAGVPVCPIGDLACWDAICWEMYNECIAKCDALPPGEDSMACAADCANSYQDCKAEGRNRSSPLPPTFPSGGGFGGTSRGGIYGDLPECDVTDPLINCGPFEGFILP